MIDQFLNRTYNAKNYNCLHFASEVFEAIAGESLLERFEGLTCGKVSDRHFQRRHRAGFERLPTGISPCVAIFQRPHGTPHIGVFYKGRILHLKETGPIYQDLDIALIPFKSVRFYKCKNN